MVNALTILSIVSLYVETLLIAYMAAQIYADQHSIFILYVLLITFSYVLTNTSSALMIRTSMDFSGRYPGKALCFALHLCQLSVAWRFSKLVLLYDKKDWFELTSLRLIHIAVQTLPFLAVHGYVTFSTTTALYSVSILALAVSLMSVSLSLTVFCVREQLHSCSWRDSNDVTSGNSKHYFGVFLLLLGNTLSLVARFACIVLMCLVVQYLVFIPLVLHFLILVFCYMSCKAVKSKSLTLKDVLARVGLSYLNIFDLVERDLHTVQCKYVIFYTVILVENIVMVAVWLLKSDVDYITKLIVMVIVLVLFICALVFKFASCGLITTVSNTHLIQREIPDNATIAESKKIIEANSVIPSISASVPLSSTYDTSNENIQEPSVDSGLTADEPPKRTDSEMNREGRGVKSKAKVTSHSEAAAAGGSTSVTDYGTYRSETQESYSIDDPTNVSHYISRDSSLVGGCKPGLHHKKKEHRFNYKARERSEVSLDICSSNSRNTNTVMTSVVDASQISAPPVQKSSSSSKKIIFPLRTMSSKWRKISLRLSSMSNLLVRSHTFRPKPSPGDTVESPEALWGDGDSQSSRSVPCEEGLHKVKTDAPALPAYPDPPPASNTTGPPAPDPDLDSHTIRGCQLSKEDRVQLWLEDIKRSKSTAPTCQCSSTSHSSDCTNLPDNKRQYVPKFEEFLADVPSHPEISFVISSKQETKAEMTSHHQPKPKVPSAWPILDSKRLKESSKRESQLAAKVRSKTMSPSKRRHRQEHVHFKDESGLSDKLDMSEERLRPRSALSKHRPESDTPTSPNPGLTRHRRSSSETCSRHYMEPDREGETHSPFFIKLDAMESLV